MQIKISGKHIELGDGLRQHIEERLQSFRERFFEGSVHGNVTLEKQRGRFLSDCSLHLATGLHLQAHAENADPQACVDGALTHLEKQLKKYKQRLKDHHRQPREVEPAREAMAYVIQAEEHLDEEPVGFHAPVIAESAATIPQLSVGEAVMQLDISTTPFVVFHNSKEGRLNVVYRRPDGNIGWLDPKPHVEPKIPVRA
ncbi:MAG: ribosome-associated translation inhibitor RaiA [Pseudomonadota bacterium]|nr:ribosome-associated translation inhibitor RaiA [Pseudomonadota bacterium]